jgi:Domain of unknown function (DUF4116)/WG containing repeat
MANELNISGKMHVKTLKSQFKEVFGLTLRVYDGRSFADDSSTLAQVRKGDAKGGEFAPQRNTKVGSFEDKMMSMFGIKVQIAGSDDSYLCNDDLTLAAAQEEDKRKMEKKEGKGAKAVEQVSAEINQVLTNIGLGEEIVVSFSASELLNSQESLLNAREIEGNSISNDAIKDKKSAIELVQDNYKELQNLSDELRKDKEVVMTAISCDGFALQYADDILKKDKEVVMAAIENEPWSLKYADTELKKDEEVILTAISKDYEAFNYVDNSLKTDTNFIQKAVACNYRVLRIIDEALKSSLVFELPIIASIENDLYGFVDIDGNEVIKPQYQYAWDSSYGLARVVVNDKRGYIDTKGNMVVAPIWDGARDFTSDGVAIVKKDGVYGLVDKTGKVIVEPQYDDFEDFKGGLAIVCRADGTQGTIDTKGEIVQKFQ